MSLERDLKKAYTGQGIDLDLTDILTPAELQQLENKKKAQIGMKRQEEKVAAKAERTKALSYRPQWQVESQILEWTVYHCACGSKWQAPGAVLPLVKFRHKIDQGKTWETAHHPSGQAPGLPREVRKRVVPVAACLNCWQVKESKDE